MKVDKLEIMDKEQFIRKKSLISSISFSLPKRTRKCELSYQKKKNNSINNNDTLNKISFIL